MKRSPAGKKQYAHVMIDLLAPDKLTAVVSLLEVMLDEPLSAEQALALDEAVSG